MRACSKVHPVLRFAGSLPASSPVERISWTALESSLGNKAPRPPPERVWKALPGRVAGAPGYAPGAGLI